MICRTAGVSGSSSSASGSFRPEEPRICPNHFWKCNYRTSPCQSCLSGKGEERPKLYRLHAAPAAKTQNILTESILVSGNTKQIINQRHEKTQQITHRLRRAAARTESDGFFFPFPLYFKNSGCLGASGRACTGGERVEKRVLCPAPCRLSRSLRFPPVLSLPDTHRRSRVGRRRRVKGHRSGKQRAGDSLRPERPLRGSLSRCGQQPRLLCNSRVRGGPPREAAGASAFETLCSVQSQRS